MNTRNIITALFALFAMTGRGQNFTFEYIQNHIYLHSKVNGKNARLVFDTGSADVYLDSTWIAESGLKYSQMGRATVRGAGTKAKNTMIIFSGVNITMGEQQYSPQMVPIINLRAVLGEQADGIFGMKDLHGKVITIDYKSGKLTLSDKLTASQTEGFTHIPIETDPNHPGQILLPISVTIAPECVISGKALLDMGSGQGIDFTSKAAIKFRLDKLNNKKPFHYEHGGVGGESAGYEFCIEKVEIGRIPVTFSRARYSTDKSGAMASDKYIAVIGNEILNRFIVIIDISNSALYLKENM